MKYQLTNNDHLAIQKTWDDAYEQAKIAKLNEEEARAAGDDAANEKTEEIMAAHADDESTVAQTNHHGLWLFLTSVVALAALFIAILGLFAPEQPITKKALALMTENDSLWKAEYADQLIGVRSTANAVIESLKNRPTYDDVNNSLGSIIKATKKAESNSTKALKLAQKSNDRVDTLQMQVNQLQCRIDSIESYKLELLNSGFVDMIKYKKIQDKLDDLERQLQKQSNKSTQDKGCKKHELKGMLKGTFQGQINVDDEEDRD